MDTPTRNATHASDIDPRTQVEDLMRRVAELEYRVQILERGVDVPLELDTLQHAYAEGHEFKPDLGPPVGRRKGTLR